MAEGPAGPPAPRRGLALTPLKGSERPAGPSGQPSRGPRLRPVPREGGRRRPDPHPAPGRPGTQGERGPDRGGATRGPKTVRPPESSGREAAPGGASGAGRPRRGARRSANMVRGRWPIPERRRAPTPGGTGRVRPFGPGPEASGAGTFAPRPRPLGGPRRPPRSGGLPGVRGAMGPACRAKRGGPPERPLNCQRLYSLPSGSIPRPATGSDTQRGPWGAGKLLPFHAPGGIGRPGGRLGSGFPPGRPSLTWPRIRPGAPDARPRRGAPGRGPHA